MTNIFLLKEEGRLIVDTTLVKNVPDVAAKILALPITHIARDELGNVMVANIVALGAIAGCAGVIGLDCLVQKKRLKPALL